MKRYLFVSLLLCLISSISIMAEKKPFGNGLFWEVNSDSVLTIFGNGDIPDCETWKSPWYDIKKNVKVIDIKEGVTSIGENAFDGFDNVSIVMIPNTVKRIGYWAFPLLNLSTLVIPQTVRIEYKAFVNNRISSIKVLNTGVVSYIWKKYEVVEPLGSNYVLVYPTCSVFTFEGKEVIPGDRGYSSIAYNYDNKTFNCSGLGIKGTCDVNGKELTRVNCAWSSSEIELIGGYKKAELSKNNNKIYYIVNKNGLYGLTDSVSKVIVPAELEALESAGTGYLRFKLNGFWGLMNYAGKILIDTSRGYTSIGDYVTFTKRFSYTMDGYKGECNHLGVQISKIKTSSATESSSSGGNKSNTTTTSDKNKTDTKEQKIIIEHHRDPVPVQQWQACWACGGMGTMGCDNCGGSGTKYIGDRLHICSRCNGQRLIPCNICHGNKGQYTTVYQ